MDEHENDKLQDDEQQNTSEVHWFITLITFPFILPFIIIGFIFGLISEFLFGKKTTQSSHNLEEDSQSNHLSKNKNKFNLFPTKKTPTISNEEFILSPDETIDKKKLEISDTILIGPVKSGKTSLLGSFEACKRRKCHSFIDIDIHFDDTDENVTLTALKDIENGLKKGELKATTDYALLNLKILTTRKFLFLFKRRKVKKITIVDAAGGYFFGEYTKGEDKDNPKYKEIWDHTIKDAKNIIYCLPLPTTVKNEDRGSLITDRFDRLINELLKNKSRRIKNIIICVTKVEKVFTEEGNDAFIAAMSHDLMLTKLAEGFRYGFSDLLPNEQSLAQFKRPPKVRIYPVSTFGFIPANGCPNLNMLEQEKLLITHNAEQLNEYTDGEVNLYWTPFMTIDPLMHVVTGKKGQLSFSLEDLNKRIEQL